MSLFFSILSRLLCGSMMVAITLLLLSVATSIRLFPRLVNWIHRLLRGFLILSYRLYRLLLASVQKPLYMTLGLNVLSGNPRLAACLLLSLTLGLLVILLIDASLIGWTFGFCVVHGLFVGLAWDDIENPGGIRIGTRIQ